MGRLGVDVGFAMAVVIYTAQVFVSRFWLRGHRFGPLEWLSLTTAAARPGAKVGQEARLSPQGRQLRDTPPRCVAISHSFAVTGPCTSPMP